MTSLWGPLPEVTEPFAETIRKKDLEIARLQKRLDECEAAVDQAVALAEYLEGHSKGSMAERVRTGLSAPFARERATYLQQMRVDLTTACDALQSIACQSNKDASQFLEMTGSYSGFDEPVSVRAARKALQDMSLTHEH